MSLSRQRIHHVADEAPEGIVLDKLLVDLGVVLQEQLHHLAERNIVGHARGMRRVLLGVLVGLVGSDLWSDLLSYPARDSV